MKLFLVIPFLFFYNRTHVKNETELSSLYIKKDARKLAEYYRQLVIRGKSMASVAQLYSEDSSSAANGGLISNVRKGLMVAEFEKAAFSLKVNEISPVFETEFGFHFIQLLSRKAEVLTLRHVLVTRD